DLLRERPLRMATTKQQTAIELRLVARSDGIDHDLRVEAVPDAPARELVAAVATELGVDGTARRDRHELPEGAQRSELALRHGDVLEFDGARRRATPAPVELFVVGGPE